MSQPSPHSLWGDVRQVIHERGDGEEAIWQAVVANKFEGPLADLLRHELARHGLTRMMQMIRRGQLHPRWVDDEANGRVVFLRRDDGVEGLANLIVAHALRTFVRRGLAGTGWKADGGSSIAGYFIGTCLFSFTDAHRDWSPDYFPYTVWAPDAALAAAPAPAPPPTDEDIRRLIEEKTGFTDDSICLLVQMKMDGYTNEQIATALHRTIKSVEGKWTRLRNRIRKERS